MIGGVKEAHIKKFSRLVQELYDLLLTIREYNPNACYTLIDTSHMALGIESENMDECPVILSERLDCESVNDLGEGLYWIDEEGIERCHYSKSSNHASYHTNRNRSSKYRFHLEKIKIGSKKYYDSVVPFYNGYKNSCILDEPLSEKDFAIMHLGVQLVD